VTPTQKKKERKNQGIAALLNPDGNPETKEKKPDTRKTKGGERELWCFEEKRGRKLAKGRRVSSSL